MCYACRAAATPSPVDSAFVVGVAAALVHATGKGPLPLCEAHGRALALAIKILITDEGPAVNVPKVAQGPTN